MNELKTNTYFLTIIFISLTFASSCRTEEAASDSVHPPSQTTEAVAAPTKQSDSSPTKQEKIVVSSEKKLQENFAEEIPPSGQTPEDFVPDGGALVKKAAGDLDGDGRDDGALVVLNKTSEVFELGGRIIAAEQYKQFLIIARQNADGRFELETHSDTALFSLIAGDAENSSAEIKIKDGKIRLRQISAFRDTMSIHENSVEKTADGWQVSGGRVTTEIPQTKIYKDGLRRIDVFEARQKTAVPLKDFDIETVELKPRRKIRTR